MLPIGVRMIAKAYGLRIDNIIDPSEGRVNIITDLSVTAFDDSSVTLQFTEVDDGQGGPADYSLLVRVKGTREFTLIKSALGVTVGATKSMIADLLDPGTTYEIAVRAVRFAPGVESFFSNVVEQATSGSIVPQPTGLATISVAKDQVDLSWTDNGGTGFSIERRDATTEGAVFAEIATVGDDVTTYSDAFAFVLDTDYEWRIFATDAGPTKSAPSNTISATPVIEQPTRPGSLSITTSVLVIPTETNITVRLAAVADDGEGNSASVVSRFWRSDDGDPAWGAHFDSERFYDLSAASLGNPVELPVSGMVPGVEYDIRFVAFRGTLNVDAVFGPLSNVLTESTASGSTDAPSALSAIVVDKQNVTFTFTDNSTAETGFEIQERVQGGTFAAIETPAASAGTGTVNASHDRGSAYTVDTNYEARVKATGSPDSDFSNTISYRPNPDPGAFRANEPTGMTTLMDKPWTEATESGIAAMGTNTDELLIDTRCGNPPCWESISDATAPKSPPKVGQWNFRAGCCKAPGPTAQVGRTFSSSEKPVVTLYIQVYFKVSSNWWGHRVGTLKFINIHPQDAGADCIIDLNGKEDGRMQTRIAIQGSHATGASNKNRTNNLANSEIIRGQWHQWELIAKINDLDVLNGELDWWLDGVKQGHYTDLGWRGPGDVKTWHKVALNMIYGGRDLTPPADQFIQIDHLYISGKAT